MRELMQPLTAKTSHCVIASSIAAVTGERDEKSLAVFGRCRLSLISHLDFVLKFKRSVGLNVPLDHWWTCLGLGQKRSDGLYPNSITSGIHMQLVVDKKFGAGLTLFIQHQRKNIDEF